MEVIGFNHGNDGGGTLINMVNKLNLENIPCTHFLVLGFKFSAIPEKFKSNIRKMVFKLLKGVPYKFTYPGNIKCKIIWDCFNTTTSSLYYCSSGYDEQFIRQTTKGLLRQIFNHINTNSTDAHINNASWSLGFIVGKNTSFTINDLEKYINDNDFTNYDMVNYIEPATPVYIEQV